MRVETQIRESEQLIQWLDSNIRELDIPSDDQTRLAAGCLDMVLEHQKAIVLLTANSLFGSAASLVRIEFEAYIRGVWLFYCASESDLEKFKKDKLDLKLGQLIQDIEKHEAFNVGTLSHVKKTSLTAMNSFTHTGIYQVVRRNKTDEIAPNYADGELIDALETANSLGILTGIAIADMAGNEKLARVVFERGQKFFKK